MDELNELDELDGMDGMDTTAADDTELLFWLATARCERVPDGKIRPRLERFLQRRVIG